MTGRQKLLSVLRGEPCDEFPVVIPYLGIFMRDHWSQVTAVPWWAVRDGNLEANLQAERDLYNALDIDWVTVGAGSSRSWRAKHRVRQEGDRFYLEDTATGQKGELSAPRIGGGKITFQCSVRAKEDVDRLVPPIKAENLATDGEHDLPQALIREFGTERFVLGGIGTPFWGVFGYFGFETLMTNLIEQPDLVEYLLEKVTAAAQERLKSQATIPVDGIWIEDCYSSADLISLEHFRRFAAPYVRRLIETCRELGLLSIYYFCGDISDRLEDIVEMQPDAVSFEESKKGFRIDLAEVDEVVNGRSCLLGNVDAIGVVQNGSREEMAREAERQFAIGRRHGRFALSLGSPVTPPTPTAKLQEFLAIARERAKC
jgi:uroporphyrinogen-III decarboxylase